MATSPCFSIIGLPCCGKTTWGKALARELGWRFIDTDEEITKRFGMAPKEIITTYGENDFRDKETQVLKEIIAQKPEGTVISCGGGIVVREENRQLLKENTIVLYLQKDLDDFVLTEEDIRQRPLLGNLESIYNERKNLYEACARKIIKIKNSE